MKNQYKFLAFAGLIFGIIILYPSCAKISSPTGGPRDTIPPVAIYSNPANYSTNFEGDNIEIGFNEFVQLQDINSTLLVSPPMEKKPMVKLKGKSIEVALQDTLRDSVTYTINFGNAIVDNNEGNPIPSFEFVFSTGNSIDSFALSGMLLNSFDLEPLEDPVFVQLYRQAHDTMPMTVVPNYIGKTNKTGYFTINNVAPGSYKVFALKDINNNYLFDLPNEQIAFQDSLIYLLPDRFEDVGHKMVEDTLMLADTTEHKSTGDTLPEVGERYVHITDSSTYHQVYGYFTRLYLFEEETENQYLVGHNREDKHRLRVILNDPFVDSIEFRPYKPDLDSTAFIPELNAGNDTLDFWLRDTTLAAIDSITTIFGFYGHDTTQTLVWKTDTLVFTYRESKETDRRGRRQSKPELKKPTNSLSINYKNSSVIDLNSHLQIRSYYPIESIHEDKFTFMVMEDTVFIPKQATLRKDTSDLHLLHVEHPIESEMNYKYELLPGLIEDIYKLGHDTITLNVRAQKTDYYGKLILNIQDTGDPLIVQLLNKNGEVLTQKYTSSNDTLITFEYLKPQAYSFKVIFDRNNNGKWDTGNYLQHIQPEKVEFIKGPITVRSNWEKEIIWSPGAKIEPEESQEPQPNNQQRRGGFR